MILYATFALHFLLVSLLPFSFFSYSFPCPSILSVVAIKITTCLDSRTTTSTNCRKIQIQILAVIFFATKSLQFFGTIEEVEQNYYQFLLKYPELLNNKWTGHEGEPITIKFVMVRPAIDSVARFSVCGKRSLLRVEADVLVGCDSRYEGIS